MREIFSLFRESFRSVRCFKRTLNPLHFIITFEKAKAHMKALKDGADGAPDAEADAAADALAGLSAGADKEKP